MTTGTSRSRVLQWGESVVFGPEPGTLDQLFGGTIAGLCIPAFLSPAECAQLRQRADALEFSDYVSVFPSIGRVGLTVFEYDRLGKHRYFEAVADAQQRLERVTQGVCDPVARVRERIASLAPTRRVEIAEEPGHGQYFAGLLRRIESGTLIHVDFAPSEQPSWSVGGVDSQAVWNIYLDVPSTDPGVIRVWQRQWSPEDERYKIADSYGYRPDVVADSLSAEIEPRLGMLVMINTRHFHQVSPADGARLTISAALGRLGDDRLVMWS
jgi:hypothetical protein